MIATANNLAGDSLMLLPARDAPYCLDVVYERYVDECCSEVILQWQGGGYLLLHADEDTDSLSYHVSPEEFRPSREYHPISDLNKAERDLLQKLVNGPKTKQQLGARAKVAGAFTREGYGAQGGGLQKRGLVAGKRLGREVRYEITAPGRRALIWNDVLGKECGWTWVAWNQQGYRDCVLFSFEGVVPTVLVCVIASSIEVFPIGGR